MRVGDTIIARSSPPGRSPRALIRLSGPDAHAVLDPMLDSAPPLASELPPTPARCVRARLHLAPLASLPVLLIRSHAPRTATGEHTAELLLPGNPALVDRVIAGVTGVWPGRVRLAEPGEFSARAFLNGRLDLVQAEGVARLIAARSEAERDSARRLVTGARTAVYGDLASRVARLLALVEAGIDFTDQDDVVAISPEDLAGGLDSVSADLGTMLAGSHPREATGERPRAVLVGPPNAGKSTLFNALLRRERSVVSATPGSTRDVLTEVLDLSQDVPGGTTVDLCDLAGLGGVLDGGTPERAAQDAALNAIREGDVLVLCEPGGRFDELEASLPEATRPRRVLRLVTKGDLPRWASDGGGGGGATSRAADALAVCALDGWRIPALRRAIADAAASLEPAGDVLPRHRAALALAAEALARTRALIDPASGHVAPPELVAAGLRDALDALGQITGRTTPDDILGRVFASFCVGK